MSIELGAIKYWIGMATSVWGLVTAYLYADAFLHPVKYLEAANVIATYWEEPQKMGIGLLDIAITGPIDFLQTAAIGLTGMTIFWYIAMKSQ